LYELGAKELGTFLACSGIALCATAGNFACLGDLFLVLSVLVPACLLGWLLFVLFHPSTARA